MFGLPMLDVMIGLMFIYVLLALICTVVMEMLAGLFDNRTRNLRYGIQNLLGEHADGRWLSKRKAVALLGNDETRQLSGKTIVSEFFAHPLVKSLREDRSLPSYLPPAIFASVVVDLLAPADGNGGKSLERFSKAVQDQLPADSDLRRTLLLFADETKDLDALKLRLEGWFNDGMDRISAWYKNKTQGVLLVIAILVSLAMNVDTIRIVQELYNSPATRTVVVGKIEASLPQLEKALAGAKGAETAERTQLTQLTQQLNQQVTQLNASGLTLGWKKWPESSDSVFSQLVGILLTAMAATLGAPFWFDLLKKFMSIRAVGKSPEEKAPATAK